MKCQRCFDDRRVVYRVTSDVINRPQPANRSSRNCLGQSGKDRSDEFDAKLNYVLGQLDLTHSRKLRVLADPAL